MAEFSYTAKNIQGTIVKGRIQAASSREAARFITQKGLFIADLTLVADSEKKFRWHGWGSQTKYAVVFCREFSVLIHAGLSIDESLKILLLQHNTSARQKVLQQIHQQIQAGSKLAEALHHYPGIFPPTMVALIAAGEASGNLEDILQALSEYLEKNYAVREKIITIMLYPFLLLSVAVVAAGFIIYFVLPAFISLFDNLHTDLPLPTRLLLQCSFLLQNYGVVLLGTFLLLVYLLYQLYQKSKYRLLIDSWLLQCPVLGKLLIQNEFIRFASTLAILLNSGIVMDQAVKMLQNITQNAYIQRIFLRAHEDIQKGYGLSTALNKSHLFPAMLMELLAAGEATGELTGVLQKITVFCQAENDTAMERLKIMIEPMMILIIGAMIGTLVFAIALPVLDTMTVLS